MKTLLTLLLLAASFWAGTRYVIVPRSEPAKVAPSKGKAASVRPAPARKADRFDPGY